MASFNLKKEFTTAGEARANSWVAIGGTIYASTNRAIYRSTNGGGTWSVIETAPNDVDYQYFLFEYLGSLWRVRVNNNLASASIAKWQTTSFSEKWADNYFGFGADLAPVEYVGGDYNPTTGEYVHVFNGAFESPTFYPAASWVLAQNNNTFTVVKKYYSLGPFAFEGFVNGVSSFRTEGVFFVPDILGGTPDYRIDKWDGSAFTTVFSESSDPKAPRRIIALEKYSGDLYYLDANNLEFGIVDPNTGIFTALETIEALDQPANVVGRIEVLNDVFYIGVGLPESQATAQNTVVYKWDQINPIEKCYDVFKDFGDLKIDTVNEQVILGVDGSSQFYEIDPAQSCDLAFDSPAYSKTNETAVDANDGTITIFALSSFTIEYSLDNVNWQVSNTFTGLAPGTYTLYIRDNNPSGCGVLSIPNVIIAEATPVEPPPPAGEDVVVNLKPVNANNLITWRSVTSGDIGFTNIICENEYWDLPTAYRLNKKKFKHFPVMVPGETFAFYINFDVPANDPSYADFGLAIIKQGGIVEQDIAGLEIDIIDGNNYNIYATITVPPLVEGAYLFAIYNKLTNVIKYVSQEIRVISANNDPDATTLTVTYRNSRNLYNFYYSNVPEFVNIHRLQLNVIGGQVEGDFKPYRGASTGKLRNVSFNLDRYVTLEAYYFDDLGHRGMQVFQAHDSIFLNNRPYLLKTPYAIEWNVLRNTQKGTIELYDQEFSTINRFGNPGSITIVGSEDPLLLGDNGDFIKL